MSRIISLSLLGLAVLASTAVLAGPASADLPDHPLHVPGPPDHLRHLPGRLDLPHPYPTTGRLLLAALVSLPLIPLWCSSWRSDSAPLIGSRLGLPTWNHVDLPHLPLTTSHPNGYLWKRDTVAELVGEGQPLVWIDDDFTPADHAWAAERTASGAVTLLIELDPYKGLQATDLEPLSLWIWAGRSPCTRRRSPTASVYWGRSIRRHELSRGIWKQRDERVVLGVGECGRCFIGDHL